MNFFDDLKARLERFMQGRYGLDALSRALLYAALPALLLGALPYLGLLSLLAYAMLGWALFRILSTNFTGRRMENEKFLLLSQPARRRATELYNRFKHRDKYAYFSCPKCRAKLRVPKGVGEITVTCKMCGHKFDKRV